MRKINGAIWTLAIGLLPITTIGQIENYPIKDYKLPVIKRTSLDLGFSTASDGLTGNVKGEPVEKATNSNFSFSGQGNASWNYYYQSPKWQTSSYATSSIRGQVRTNSKEDQSNKNNTDNSSLSTLLFVSNSSLYYFRKNLFTSFSPHGGINYGRGKSSIKYKDNTGTTIIDNDHYYNYTTSYAGLGFGVGYGRIEPVGDAHKMVFTLLDLKKRGSLLREPSTEEITQISQKLSSLENERYFDSREHTVKEVTLLDSLITSMGLTNRGDIKTATTLYDNLSYAYTPSRYSGFRIMVKPLVGYSNSTDKQTGIEKFNTHQTTIGANANLTYETPINIYWQRSINLNASYTDQTIDCKNVSPANKYKESEIKLSGGYGYYPNTRTNLNFTLGGRYRNIDSDETYNGMPVGLKYGEVFANGSLYYYLSPKVRIDASAQLAYKTNIDANANFVYNSELQFDKNAYDKFTTKEFSYGFSAKLTYAIF